MSIYFNADAATYYMKAAVQRVLEENSCAALLMRMVEVARPYVESRRIELAEMKASPEDVARVAAKMSVDMLFPSELPVYRFDGSFYEREMAERIAQERIYPVALCEARRHTA